MEEKLNVDEQHVAIKKLLKNSVNAFYTQSVFIFWARYVFMNCNNKVFEMKMGL